MTKPIATAINTNTTIASEPIIALLLSVARSRVKIVQHKQTGIWYQLICDDSGNDEIGYADSGGARSFG